MREAAGRSRPRLGREGKALSSVIISGIIGSGAPETGIQATGRGRAAYSQRLFNVKPSGPMSYHRVVNTGWLDVQATVEPVMRSAEPKPQPR